LKNQESDLIKQKKRWLKRYRKHKRCIIRLEDKLETLNARLSSVKATTYSGMPRGGVPIGKDDMVAEKIELEKRIARLNEKGKRLRNEIIEVIDELEDERYAMVLESFCIDCLELEDIADDKGYSTRQIYRLYSEAVEEVNIMSV